MSANTDAQMPADLESPLLGNCASRDTGEPAATDTLDSSPASSCKHYCSLSEATYNLAITAVGAGVLALPKAMATVGAALGILVVSVVCIFTYFSASIIVTVAQKTQLETYGDIIRSRFGGAGATLLQCSIILHVAGAMMVYLMIIADVLVGIPPHYSGLLPEWLNEHSCPWYLSRVFVLLVLVVVVEVPLFGLRSIRLLSRLSGCCVVMTLFLALVICGLCGVAHVQGKLAPDIVILPDAWALHHLWSGSVLVAVREVLGSMAVAALAYTCHFNLIPIQRSLAPQAVGHMEKVVRNGVLLCYVLYVMVGLSGYLLFGSATRGDVLKNLSIRYVTDLVGAPAAHLLLGIIGLTYPFNLLINFALRIWGLRENVCGLLFRKTPMAMSLFGYYSVTYAILVIVFVISILVPSVWCLVEIIGSTACMVFAYIFPALLVLTQQGLPRTTKVAGGVLLAAGVCIAIVGTQNALVGGACSPSTAK